MPCPSISTVYNRLFHTTQDPESQQIHVAPGTRAVKATVPATVNKIGFTGKIFATATALSLAAFFTADKILMVVGGKKASNLLAQQTNLPKIAMVIGQGVIYGYIAANFAALVTDIIFGYDFDLPLPELVEDIFSFGLLSFGTYHAIELITKEQQYVKNKLD